jgi:hypothetical protein
MNGGPRLLASFFLLFAACSASGPAPTQISQSQAIAVLPPNNRTGDPLLVSGASFLDRYVFHAEPATVGDVLAGEARFQLAERGYRVTPREAVQAAAHGQVPESAQSAAEIAAQGKLGGLVLYLEIRHWEPDAPIHTRFVIVGVSASLVEPQTGNVVWQLDRRSAPVATPGEVMVEDAYATAARKVIAEILSPLGATQTPP